MPHLFLDLSLFSYASPLFKLRPSFHSFVSPLLSYTPHHYNVTTPHPYNSCASPPDIIYLKQQNYSAIFWNESHGAKRAKTSQPTPPLFVLRFFHGHLSSSVVRPPFFFTTAFRSTTKSTSSVDWGCHGRSPEDRCGSLANRWGSPLLSPLLGFRRREFLKVLTVFEEGVFSAGSFSSFFRWIFVDGEGGGGPGKTDDMWLTIFPGFSVDTRSGLVGLIVKSAFHLSRETNRLPLISNRKRCNLQWTLSLKFSIQNYFQLQLSASFQNFYWFFIVFWNKTDIEKEFFYFLC
jgi:hypothetical protein